MKILVRPDSYPQASAVAAALTTIGIGGLSNSKTVPVRSLTQFDVDRIEAAKAKRERKAMKRASS